MQHLPHQQNTRGFIGIALLIGVAVLSVASAIYTNYELAKVTKEKALGASIQTQLTDTIGTFRTNVNTSLTTLDAAVATVTSTINTYGNLVTINSPLPVANGGTATTTAPTDAQIFSSVGAVPTWKSFTVGTGLLSTTTATSIQLGSAGFDSTANITFSGNNTHNGSETFSSSTTFNATSSFNSSTIFTAIPTIPSSTPVNVTDAASKNYVDANRPIFVTATSSAVNETAVTFSTTGNFVYLASTTFILANPGRIMVITQGNGMNDTAGDGCKFTAYLDGTNMNILNGNNDTNRRGLSGFVDTAGSTYEHSIGFTIISTSTLTAASHTVGFMGQAVTAGICSAYFGMQIEFIGN